MKAVRFNRYGGPDVLGVVDVDEPGAGAGEIRIAVRAAGVNGMDWKIRSGSLRDQMPLDLPAGTGIDAAGVVDQVGSGVSDVAVGDAVFGLGRATMAQHAVLTSWAVKPAGLSFEEAGGYPTAVETATRLLREAGIAPGETLLVSGATGGVGSAVLQLARDGGIAVIGTASDANQDYVRSLGATATTYGDGLIDRVRALAPGGVAAALDLAGSGVIDDLIQLTGKPDRVVSISDFSAPKHGARVSTGPSPADIASAAFAAAARLFTDGVFSLRVERTFPLDRTGDAQQANEAGHTVGKIVVVID